MSATAQSIYSGGPAPIWSGMAPAPHAIIVESDPLARLNSRLGSRLGSLAMAVALAAEDELFDQDTPAHHGYRIVSGCLRTVRLMEDGRRLIDRFLFPGDLLGFAAGTHHDVSAQAIGPTVLRRYPLRDVMAAAAQDAALARFLWQTASSELHAAHRLALLLGRKTATERVASFLLDMGRRMDRASGAAAARITLPMGRADIADHLGLTVETVSRGLSQMQRDGVITVMGGRILVRDHAELLALAGDNEAAIVTTLRQ